MSRTGSAAVERRPSMESRTAAVMRGTRSAAMGALRHCRAAKSKAQANNNCNKKLLHN